MLVIGICSLWDPGIYLDLLKSRIYICASAMQNEDKFWFRSLVWQVIFFF